MPVEVFCEWIDRKQREAKRHLKIIEQLLHKAGMQAKGHLEDDEPYVFLKATNSKLSFDGIRIYEIGSMVAYRVSKEEKTEPYGKAYQLNLEEMFNDCMSDNPKEDDAAHKVIEGVVHELKRFFDKSADAERELKSSDFAGDSSVILKTGGTDYSSLVFNRS